MEDLKKRSAVFNEKTLTVEIDIINPTIMDRIRRRTKVTKIVRQPPIGVLEEIGSIVARVAVNVGDPSELLPMIFERMKVDAGAQIAVLACLMDCNPYPKNETRKLIRGNLRPAEILDLFNQLFEFADLKSFLNTTILMKGMGLLKSGEIIAPRPKKNEREEVKTSGEQ